MSIQLVFIYLYILISQILATCPYIRTSVILAECTFDTNLYISLGANILNSNTVDFIGYYSIGQKDQINNTLIYNLGNRWMLLVPLLIKCNRQPVNLTFTECQYTMRQMKSLNRLPSSAEYMTTQLTIMNISDLGMQSVLFLQPGEISLRSCKAYDCTQQLVYLTASNETFNFKINYEKPIDTPCQYDEDCQNSYSIKDLIHCNKLTHTCQCTHQNISSIDIAGIGRFCTDSIDQSHCKKFPRRCLKWCNKSETSHCVCPSQTRKAKKTDGVFDCELEPTGICQQFDDDDHLMIGPNIRKCPTGTYCDGYRCRQSTSMQQIQDELSNQLVLSSSTQSSVLTTISIYTLFPSTYKHMIRQNQTKAFIRTLIAIFIAMVLIFILIIVLVIILVKSRRFRSPSKSSEDKVSSSSSSSYAQSTSTAVSSDSSSTDINYHQQSKINSNYENYIPQSTFVHGLVPQINLSPKFHRQQNTIDEKRRIPLNIRSPSLSRMNPFVDHASLATNEYCIQKRSPLPKVTHLQNGNVIISA